ncbi:hypothetical protein [Paramagnetospirillum magnetotacticum]|uniref:hypothetical protein n=1 Tax=Paramagnetospirillum magnetotacticum TaxID=188 RepID=UPI001269EF3C|nr:hypothetical protein [Paramagnetospirillum magnetotacticum]
MSGRDNKKLNAPIEPDGGHSENPVAPEEVYMRPRLPAYMDEVLATIHSVKIFEIASHREVAVVDAELRNGEWYVNYFMCDRDDGLVHRDLVRADDYLTKSGAACSLYELLEKAAKGTLAESDIVTLRE